MSDEQIDVHIHLAGQAIRRESQTRNTLSETLDVRFFDWNEEERGRPRPHNFLTLLIQRLLTRVLVGRAPPRFVGFSLQPPGWSRPFHIPLRPLAQNTASAIAAALERFLQDYDGLDLFDGSCLTKVSAIWPLPLNNNNNDDDDDGPMGACAPDLATARAHAAGIARCQSWVAVVNPNDTYCLARAIVLGLMDRRHQLLHQPNAHFRLWAEGQRGDEGQELALELMNTVGIPVDQPMYGVREARRVQNWLNTTLGGPHHVRLVLLERERGWRVCWKSPEPAHFTLTLACVNHHWSYIQCPQQIFRVHFLPHFSSTIN